MGRRQKEAIDYRFRECVDLLDIYVSIVESISIHNARLNIQEA